MVKNSFHPFLVMIFELWLPLLPVVVYVTIVCWLDIQFHLEDVNFPVPILAILGSVIGLLLAFRANSSYGRWWEARILWGAIVNDSRTWVRQLMEFNGIKKGELESGSLLRQMAYRQIAWCYALSRALRRQSQKEDLSGFLKESEVELYDSDGNVPNELLLKQAFDLNQLYSDKRIELFQFIELEKTLTRLTNSMGGCERINNTPFPATYNRMVNGLIYLFVIFLPFGLSTMPPVGLVGVSLSFAFAFFVIERVSIYLQDPFSNRPSDTPMLSLSRTIEINIKRMLGEEDLPDKLHDVNGVSY